MLSIVDYKFKKIISSVRFEILFTEPMVTYTTENKLNKFLSYVDSSTGELKEIVKVSISRDNCMNLIVINPDYINSSQLRLLTEIVKDEFSIYLNGNATKLSIESICEA